MLGTVGEIAAPLVKSFTKFTPSSLTSSHYAFLQALYPHGIYAGCAQVSIYMPLGYPGLQWLAARGTSFEHEVLEAPQ